MNQEKLKKISYAIGYLSVIVVVCCVLIIVVALTVGAVQHLLF